MRPDVAKHVRLALNDGSIPSCSIFRRIGALASTGLAIRFFRKGADMNATTAAVDLATSVFPLAVAGAHWLMAETHLLTRAR